MTKRESLNGKPYAGTPHVRFDEEEDAPYAQPPLGKLCSRCFIGTVISLAALSPLHADVPPATTVGANNDRVLALIETRPADASDCVPNNPGGWIETRPCDDNTGLASVDTLKTIGFTLIVR
ncbi:MAG: hypothetical protein IKJ37_06505 [Kiritimatiellae bacterium]|nr:hypothetical protein [Kiritimatiellia bacterium]